MSVLLKTKCFYIFTNNSKSEQNKTIPHTVFETLTAILDTKLERFRGGFFDLEI